MRFCTLLAGGVWSLLLTMARPGFGQTPTRFWGHRTDLDSLPYVDGRLQRQGVWALRCAQGYTLVCRYFNGQAFGDFELYDASGALRLTCWPTNTFDEDKTMLHLSNNVRVYGPGSPGTPGPVRIDLGTYGGELHGPAQFFDAQGRELCSGSFADGRATGLWRVQGIGGRYAAATLWFTEGLIMDYALFDAAGQRLVWTKQQDLFVDGVLYYHTPHSVFRQVQRLAAPYRCWVLDETARAVREVNALLRLLPRHEPGLLPVRELSASDAFTDRDN